MSEIDVALTELQRGLRVYRAFEGAEAAIRVLQNQKQVERELSERLERLRAEVDTILGAARTQAAEIIAEAEARAAAATRAEERRLAEMNEAYVNAKGLRDTLSRHIKDKKREQAELEAEVATLEARAEAARVTLRNLGKQIAEQVSGEEVA